MAGQSSTPGSPRGQTEAAPLSSASAAPAPHTVPTQVEFVADDNVDDTDGDSALGAGSDTTSVMSSVLKYRLENGRTYHSYKATEGVNYWLPNDDREADRLDLQYDAMLMTQGGQLYLCPAGKDGKPLNRVLDVGTGTGTWAIEFADQHPEVTVTGNDLSRIQPEFTPPNVEFFIDDAEVEWNYSTPFNFINIRLMSGSIKDWPKLMRQSFQFLTPGGWIEVADPINPLYCDDGTLTEDLALTRWNKLLLEASIKLGVPLNGGLEYKKQLEDAGFVNVVEHKYKWPINDWPKDPNAKMIGLWMNENVLNGLEAFSLMMFTNVLGFTVEEVQLLLVDVRKDLKNRRIHAYWPYYVVYGQKPE